MIHINVSLEYLCQRQKLVIVRIPMMQQVYDVLQEEYERQKQEGFALRMWME